MNNKSKKKEKKLPEKFKYYEQEINQNKIEMPNEYLKIKTQLLNLDLNKPEDGIGIEYLKNLEKYSSFEQIRFILNEEIENSTQYLF